MRELVYAEFHKTIKKYLVKSKSDTDVAELILGSIILNCDLTNKVNDPIMIEKHTASKLINRKTNVHKKIRSAISSVGIKEEIAKYCAETFLPALDKDLLSKLIKELVDIIDADDSIPLELSGSLKTNANTENIHLFLRDIILYVVKIDNVAKKTVVSATYKNKRLPVQDAPKDVQKEELPYVNAILEAYADKLRIKKLKKVDVDSYGFTDNFNRQRKSYYNAEYVGRMTRDAFFDETPQPFEDLKDEIKSGIIDVWENDYKDGFERMSNVLTQATNTTVESTFLGRNTVWASNDVKKGICHVLVNEKKLKGWIKK